MFCPSYRTHGLPYSSSVWKTCFAIICQLLQCCGIIFLICSAMFWSAYSTMNNMFWCTCFPIFHHFPQCSARIPNACSLIFNHVKACSAMFCYDPESAGPTFHLLGKERVSYLLKVSYFLLPKYRCSSIYVGRFGNLNWCLNACSPFFFLLFRTIV